MRENERLYRSAPQKRSTFAECEVIEDVWDDNSGICTIWLAYTIPDSTEQDMIIPRESYDEVKRMIEEATK